MEEIGGNLVDLIAFVTKGESGAVGAANNKLQQTVITAVIKTCLSYSE